MENVGLAIKALRAERNLSQRAVARQAGVSNGAISLIESGKHDPTIGQLKKILEVFGISIGEFFQETVQQTTKYFFSPSDFTEIGSGKISYRQLAKPSDNRVLQVLTEAYQPGADTGPSMLSHEGEEAGLILEGELEVQVGNQSRILCAGDAYQFPSRLPHRFRNLGGKECKLLSVCTPPSF